MKKGVAEALKLAAESAAQKFSSPTRKHNVMHEMFEVEKIVATGEHSANVIFLKSTGKRALALFLYIKAGDPYWTYFFVGYEHLVAFERARLTLAKIEAMNFDANFN